jgi:hypothetical protein
VSYVRGNHETIQINPMRLTAGETKRPSDLEDAEGLHLGRR